MYTYACVHGRERAVYTAEYGPCRTVYTAVYVPCTGTRAVYTARAQYVTTIFFAKDTFYACGAESDADEYLSVMREKNNLVCNYFYRFAYMLKYSLFGNFELFILILDHENIRVDA